MIRQVGGCTAAFESKQFPYFTINITRPGIHEGNRGGLAAFFERRDFVADHLDAITEYGCYVDGDCGFVVRDEYLPAFADWLVRTAGVTLRRVTDEAL